MIRLYLDIETLPALDDSAVDLTDLEPPPGTADDLIGQEPASYKSDAAKAKWREERCAKLRDAYRQACTDRLARTALEPLHGSVLCVGIAVGDAEPVVLWGDDERQTLELLQRGLIRYADAEIVAYNGIGFDLMYLAKRALRLGLYPLSGRLVVRKRWGQRGILDPLQVWQGADTRARGRLPEVAAYLGYEVTDPHTGADIHRLWVEGQHDAIRTHVAEDVRMLRHVTQCMDAAGWL